MRLLSDETGSSGDSSSQGEDGDPFGDFENSPVKKQDLAKIANKKTRLLIVLNSYNIRPTRSQYSDWSDLFVCPFPFHKGGNERTPSFGYNFVEDRFHCFGCNTSGRTVEFIAFRNGLDRNAVAEQILRETEGYDFAEEVEEDENPKIDAAIFEFSSFLNSLHRKHKDDSTVLEQIDKVIWWFDLYLATKAPKDQIFVEELEYRISKAIELLKGFE